MSRPLRIGIAPHELARAQAASVQEEALRTEVEVGAAATPTVVVEVPAASEPSAGLFLDMEAEAVAPVDVLRSALAAGQVDVLLHHVADVPPGGIAVQQLAAVLARRPRGEVLLGHGPLADLAPGARVAVDSTRSGILLQAERPDLNPVHLRGGPRTCLEKLAAGAVHALILPEAVALWIGAEASICDSLPLERFLPAPGQGILVIEVRPDDVEARAWAQRLESARTRLELAVELACAEHLGGAAVRGVHAQSHPGEIRVLAFICGWDGEGLRRAERVVAAHLGLAEARSLAADVAQELSPPRP